MKSQFEKNAADAAVSAVEARWRRQHLQDLRQLRRKRFNNLFFGTLLIVIVAVAGWALWQWYQGRPIADVAQIAELPAQVGKLFKPSPEQRRSAEYGEQLRKITDQPLKRLKDLPDRLWPEKAPAGTVYLALKCGKTGVPMLFRLEADGHGTLSATELSPIAPERELKWSNFKTRCPTPYLLSIEGSTYLSGSRDLKDGEVILRRVREALVL